jgi:hypothetical protein
MALIGAIMDTTENTGGGRMAKADRKDLVVAVLEDTQAAMPTVVLLRNAKARGARFEISALRNYLAELLDEQRVRKVDATKLAQRELVDVGTESEGYWIAASFEL